jgi:hypothetical protein
MKMSSLRMQLPAILVASLIMVTCACNSPSGKPRPVEVWRGGDEELTGRLKNTLESAFESSPDFVLSRGKKPGTLMVMIPTHVRSQQVGGRTQVLYTAEFAATDDQRIGASTGSCWDDALMTCASQIIKDAKVAARKLRQ